MDSSSSKLLFTYLITVTIVMISMGIIILPFIPEEEKIIAGITLFGGLVIFVILILNLFEKYIKPVRSAAKVADQLVKGNYKARTYLSYYGDAGKLSNSINMLARSLNEKTIQEKMFGSQLRTVIDNMESGLMLIDDKGYVHLVNPKFLSLFGKESKDYTGSLYYDVLEQERIHKAVQEAFLYEEKVSESFTISMRIGKKYVEVVGAPIFNDKGDLKGVVLVFHDISELKRLEQTRKDFVANVSHELKTPITSITGFAETLLDEAMEDKELLKQFLSIILKESKRLQALVHDLLELSKIERDESQIELHRINLVSIADEILPIIHPLAENKSILLSTNYPDVVEVNGDPHLLKQVLINLLNNAINYSHQNGKVHLDINSNKDRVKIEIIDNGIGIPEEAQTRIFERFYRVDRARSRNTGGTGLGLAIVKHIVEAHHGSIELESQLEKGSTFRIILPRPKKET